jgi:hypothetical protein
VPDPDAVRDPFERNAPVNELTDALQGRLIGGRGGGGAFHQSQQRPQGGRFVATAKHRDPGRAASEVRYLADDPPYDHGTQLDRPAHGVRTDPRHRVLDELAVHVATRGHVGLHLGRSR